MAKTIDVAVDHSAHLAGRIQTPDAIDEGVDLDGAAGVDRQGGQDRTLPRRTQRHARPVDVQLHRSQQSQPDLGHKWTLRRARNLPDRPLTVRRMTKTKPWPRIAVLGDSITVHPGDPVDGFPTLTWAERLVQDLEPDAAVNL